MTKDVINKKSVFRAALDSSDQSAKVFRSSRDAMMTVLTGGDLIFLVVNDHFFKEAFIMVPPVSRSMVASLESLTKAIQAAEARLRKMPAHGEAAVSLTDLLGMGYYLVTNDDMDNDTECRIAVAFWREGDEPAFERWLDEYPVAKRVELARWIPNLIDAAKACEHGMSDSINDVVMDIEQAIADS